MLRLPAWLINFMHRRKCGGLSLTNKAYIEAVSEYYSILALYRLQKNL
jgi:hypothetical protein